MFLYQQDIHGINVNRYGDFSNFLLGYFDGLSANPIFSERFLNREFSDWLSSKYGQNSMVWCGYVFHLLADKDEELALQLVVENLELWLSEIDDW